MRVVCSYVVTCVNARIAQIEMIQQRINARVVFVTIKHVNVARIIIVARQRE
jgi:hypothetical protein